MTKRGMYDRDGELFAMLDGDHIYDLDGNPTGEVRGRTIYDAGGERHWLIDGDALLDLRGNVLGYLGEAVPPDESDL
jgi:hypothetical protein